MNKWFSEIHSVFPFTTFCYWQDTLFPATKLEEAHEPQIKGQKWMFWMLQGRGMTVFSWKHVYLLFSGKQKLRFSRNGEWGIGISIKIPKQEKLHFHCRVHCATWPSIFHLLCRPCKPSSWNPVYFHAVKKIKWEQYLDTKNGVAVSVATILPFKYLQHVRIRLYSPIILFGYVQKRGLD